MNLLVVIGVMDAVGLEKEKMCKKINFPNTKSLYLWLSLGTQT